MQKGVQCAGIHFVFAGLLVRLKRLEEQTAELIGKPVTLVNMIDEGLIGGVLISADGKLIDASLKKRMEDLSLRLRSRPEGGSPL